jgi:hypothetical protein
LFFYFRGHGRISCPRGWRRRALPLRIQDTNQHPLYNAGKKLASTRRNHCVGFADRRRTHRRITVRTAIFRGQAAYFSDENRVSPLLAHTLTPDRCKSFISIHIANEGGGRGQISTMGYYSR